MNIDSPPSTSTSTPSEERKGGVKIACAFGAPEVETKTETPLSPPPLPPPPPDGTDVLLRSFIDDNNNVFIVFYTTAWERYSRYRTYVDHLVRGFDEFGHPLRLCPKHQDLFTKMGVAAVEILLPQPAPQPGHPIRRYAIYNAFCGIQVARGHKDVIERKVVEPEWGLYPSSQAPSPAIEGHLSAAASSPAIAGAIAAERGIARNFAHQVERARLHAHPPIRRLTPIDEHKQQATSILSPVDHQAVCCCVDRIYDHGWQPLFEMDPSTGDADDAYRPMQDRTDLYLLSKFNHATGQFRWSHSISKRLDLRDPRITDTSYVHISRPQIVRELGLLFATQYYDTPFSAPNAQKKGTSLVSVWDSTTKQLVYHLPIDEIKNSDTRRFLRNTPGAHHISCFYAPLNLWLVFVKSFDNLSSFVVVIRRRSSNRAGRLDHRFEHTRVIKTADVRFAQDPVQDAALKQDWFFEPLGVNSKGHLVYAQDRKERYPMFTKDLKTGSRPLDWSIQSRTAFIACCLQSPKRTNL